MTDQKVAQPIEKIADAASQVARAESEPAPVRRYRAILFQASLVIVAIAFGILTFLVKTMPTFSIDLQITRAIQSIKIPFFGELMNLISWPGFNPQSFIIAGLVVIVIYAFGMHWEAVMAVIAAVLSTGIDIIVKDLIQRPRPLPAMVTVFATLTSYSFPSGHVMFYLGFFGYVAFLAFSLWKPTLRRTLLLVLIGLLVALIGVSRVYLGEHWASDVLGSYLLGTLTLVTTIQIYRWGKPRFSAHQPVPTAEPKQA